MYLKMKYERILLSDKNYDEISKLIRLSYPNACILWIDKIINNTLENEQKILIEEITQKRKQTPKIMQMFHGTREQNIEIIANRGFDVNYNKVSAYGRGTYFAKNANYSCGYTDCDKDKISYMFLCDVVVGKTTCVGSNMSIDTQNYDNSVDNPNNIHICVTPYNAGGIPKYIIAFYKFTS